MNYKEARRKAIKFLQTFTRSEFSDLSVYNRMKAYRYRHNKGTLPKGAYENVLVHLGFQKIERWNESQKQSDLLVNILTDGATD